MNKKIFLYFIIIFNYLLDWVKKYKKNSYYFIDLVILMVKDKVVFFVWDDNFVINKKLMDFVVFKLVWEYNIVNGYIFVFYDNSNNMVMLNIFNGSDDSIFFDESIEINKEKI